jgi:hypothetical protein
VLTCQDKILNELLDENNSEEDSDYKISSLNNSVNKGTAPEEAKSDIKIDASFVKEKTKTKDKKVLSQSIRARFNQFEID